MMMIFSKTAENCSKIVINFSQEACKVSNYLDLNIECLEKDWIPSRKLVVGQFLQRFSPVLGENRRWCETSTNLWRSF